MFLIVGASGRSIGSLACLPSSLWIFKKDALFVREITWDFGYYIITDRLDDFAAATVPEALFALNWVPRILNKEKLADNLVGRGGNHEITYYQDIFRVPPGSTVEVCGPTFSKYQFWNLEGIADVKFTNDQDYVEAFKVRLEEAVRARLRSRHPPCAMITGGLDSSSISVIAADILAASGGKLNTFTAVPQTGFSRDELRGRYFDETPYVRQIAEVNRDIVPHFITQSREPIPEKIAEVIRRSGLPGGILNALWGFDIFAAARSAGHDVILAGELGNTTISYDGSGLFTELLVTGRWLRLFSEIKSSGYRWRRHVRHQLIGPFIPAPLFRKYKQWRRGGKPAWHDYSLIRLESRLVVGVVDRAAREYIPFDAPPTRNSRLGRIDSFRDYCEAADWYAKVRAEFCLDLRTPACDRRVVEFCIGIPEDQYLCKGRDRWLIRRAMDGRLPEIVLNQQKTGAQAADWYPRLTRPRNRIVDEVKRLAENPEVASILDMQRLNAILNSWPDRQPSEYTPEEKYLLAVPNALGTAYFIESLTGANYSRFTSAKKMRQICGNGDFMMAPPKVVGPKKDSNRWESNQKQWRRPALRKLPIAATAGGSPPNTPVATKGDKNKTGDLRR